MAGGSLCCRPLSMLDSGIIRAQSELAASGRSSTLYVPETAPCSGDSGPGGADRRVPFFPALCVVPHVPVLGLFVESSQPPLQLLPIDPVEDQFAAVGG